MGSSDFIRSIPSSSSEPSRERWYRLSLTSATTPDTVRIADEQATSGSDKAEALNDGDRDAVFLTPDEARWLHGALGELVAAWDAAADCPGEGRCHGTMKWCANCGDVGGVCDARDCDAHKAVSRG